ncbi:MAG: hypothetical protein WBP17_11005, partial [Gemmatimonadota bacterium]
STRVGKDLFRRATPSNEEVVRRLQMGPASHPLLVSTWDSPSRDGRERELELEVESCSLAGTG